MLVLHAIWDANQLYLWAESSALPASLPTARGRPPKRPTPKPHPFSVPGKMLREEIETIFGPTTSGIETRTLLLPGAKRGPLPSPWLIRENSASEEPLGLSPWRVETLTFDPRFALDLLLDLPANPPAGIVFGNSLRFWIEAARLALELIAKEQFAPTLRDGRARWMPVTDEEDRKRIQMLSKAMPPSSRAFEPEPKRRSKGRARGRDAASSSSSSSPRGLVTSFIDGAVDAFVRHSLREVRLDPPTRGRKPKITPLSCQFLQALTGDDPALDASTGDLGAFSKEMGAWLAGLKPVAEDAPFRTCFRLDAPLRTDEEAWQIRIFLQASDDRSLLVPAGEIWKARSDTATFLKRRITNPQERLLADLGRASRISPSIESCLHEARPSGLELETEEAYSFLREEAPLLEQNGFGVLLPSWWEKPGARLGLKVRLKAPDDYASRSTGRGLFGLKSIVGYDVEAALGDSTLSEADLQELISLKVPLVRVRGEWVELPPEEIEAAIEFFKKTRREGGEMDLAEAIRLGLGAEEAIEGQLPVLMIEAEGRIRDMLARLSGKSAIERVDLPAGFNGTLRPYQATGLSWLCTLHELGFGACLADDMGLGKTIELIVFLLHERATEAKKAKSKPESKSVAEIDTKAEPPGPSLLICPMSVVGNWTRELAKFSPSLRAMVHHGPERLSEDAFAKEAETCDIVVTTYATAQRDEDTLSRVRWEHLVLDEAQNIKNPNTKQTRAIKRLVSDHRIALTGTPVENRLSELWSIMDFLNPGYLGNAKSFHEKFALPIEKYQNRDQAEKLRRMTQPFILRRLKTDPSIIRDLPDKVEAKVYYNLTPEQASLYGAVVEEMLDRIERSEGIERKGLVLATLTKLKQICNHPALFLQDGSPLPGRSGKLGRLEEMLDELLAEGDKALIFTQFAGMGAMLRHHLQETLGREVLFLHGKTPKKQRDAMIERFQSDGSASGSDGPPLFILSLKAGGFGLNLTAANYVFHFDRWWNPAVEDQATDRAFRIGQKKNVFVNKFVCMGTLEERIDNMIEDKKGLAESVIGAGEAWLTELSFEELREVLTLSRDSLGSDQS
jgi:SNF2 family DNA or RNA helicase